MSNLPRTQPLTREQKLDLVSDLWGYSGVDRRLRALALKLNTAGGMDALVASLTDEEWRYARKTLGDPLRNDREIVKRAGQPVRFEHRPARER